MATATVTSACTNRISQNFCFEDKGSHLRDASFSSYLGGGEETVILKPHSAAVAATESPCLLSHGREYGEDGEISIFGAEKYFSGRMDNLERTTTYNSKKQQLKKEGSIDVLELRKTLKSTTPSTCSEASWNSWRALLQKDRTPNLQKQMSSKRFVSSFGCNCISNKSIDIDDEFGKNRTSSHCKKIVDLGEEFHGPEIVIKRPTGIGQTRPCFAPSKQNSLKFKNEEETDCRIVTEKGSIGFKGENYFAFPLLNSVVGNKTVGKQLNEERAQLSPEVFGPHYKMVNADVVSKLEKRMTKLISDNVRLVEGIPVSSSRGGRVDDEDLASDSSSDLFEIESLTSKAHPLFHLQASDDLLSCTATPTCYEPSEAGFEWSLVTAGATNPSVASDSYNPKPREKSDLETIITTTTATTTTTTATTKTKTSMGRSTRVKEVQRHQPISLLGCSSAKAVKVVANAHKVSSKLEPEQRQL